MKNRTTWLTSGLAKGVALFPTIATIAAGVATAATCIVNGDPVAASNSNTSVLTSASTPLVTGTLSTASDSTALRSDKVLATIIILR